MIERILHTEPTVRGKFTRALEAALAKTHPGAWRHESAASVPAPSACDPDERRREWFAKFAEHRVMPLLEAVAEAARKHGAAASCALHDTDGRLAAELVLVRFRPPGDARPPRLTVYAAAGEPPLMVEFTGTFPRVGAFGGFGAEVDYDAIYPSQLYEKVIDFVALAGGRGAPLA